jgi:hypothetical protein
MTTVRGLRKQLLLGFDTRTLTETGGALTGWPSSALTLRM